MKNFLNLFGGSVRETRKKIEKLGKVHVTRTERRQPANVSRLQVLGLHVTIKVTRNPNARECIFLGHQPYSLSLAFST